jgi:6-phosphogluconolactonase
MTNPTVVVHADDETVALAVAARLVTRAVDAQAARGSASVVITGGTIVNASLAAVADSALRDTVDWSRLDLWWGDERFLPIGDPERNETQARAALLDSVPLDPSRVHPMPAAGGRYSSPERAAEAYASELARAARPEDHGPVPTFDVVVLGMGPDGHVASLFPGHPALYDEGTVTGVRGAPKPPPDRVSLTLPTINTARQVWIVATGEAKAKAVRMALSGAGPVQIPSAGVRGRSQTLWLLDRAAASALPRGLDRLASP